MPQPWPGRPARGLGPAIYVTYAQNKDSVLEQNMNSLFIFPNSCIL